MTRALARGCVIMAAVVLSACGSSAPSKASFIAKADAICASGDAQIKAVPTPPLTGTQSSKLAALGRYVERVVPVARGVITRLKALAQPTQDRALLQQYLNALDVAAAHLDALGAAASTGSAAAVAARAGALRADHPDTFALRYGLKVCGESQSAA